MLIKTRGIILRAIKYRESSLILEIYTEMKGLRKYLISGVRSRKAKTQAGLLQIMSLVDLVAYEREDRDLTRIKEVRPAEIYQRIPFDFRRGSLGLFLAEITRKTIREREENTALFQFLYDSFLFLDRTPDPIANLHLQFLLELSTFLGFMPTGVHSPETPLFDLREGEFISQLPGHKYYLEEARAAQLQQLLDAPRDVAHQISLSREERRSLLDALILYYRLHMEGLKEIHAHEILRQVME
jgi:DNA repair protein RecO (recombination protein O)